MLTRRLFTLLALLASGYAAVAQSAAAPNFWQVVAPETVALPAGAQREIEPTEYQTFQLDYEALCQYLATAPREQAGTLVQPIALTVPNADGTLEPFAVYESSVMPDGVRSRWPLIRAYTGYSLRDPARKVSLTTSPDWGLNVMIRRADRGIEYVEPVAKNQNTWYQAYDRLHFPQEYRHPERLLKVDIPTPANEYSDRRGPRALAAAPAPTDRGELLVDPNPVKVKVYRFACATTGEFSQDNGGTLSAVLAKMVDYTNRLNLIYESDLDIRLILIEQIENILFLDPNTDPYTGLTAGGWMDQNPAAMNAAIGFGSYDLGHVFARYIDGDAAGVAGGQCCGDLKGRGCSTGGPVYGDYFFGVVSQEIGHQWSGGHTWTFCQFGNGGGPGDAPGSACEPGSGSTIMSYAGVCATNVQGTADLYYNVCSIVEIRNFVENGIGNECGTEVETTNHPPVVTIPIQNNLFIPISTPFELTGSAVDPDGDPMTYNWEQANPNEPLVPIGQPVGNTSIFRSFPPSATGFTRSFPRTQSLVTNTSSINEVLPTYTRDLTFCLTARDNKSGGGGIGIDTLELRTTDLAGPFVVTSPNSTTVTWHPGEYQLVTWDVANTNNSLVNCQTVNIRLSTNSGSAFPITLATGVPNTGAACVLVPNNVSNSARIRVEAADNVFFDISNVNFKIQAPVAPGFDICTGAVAAQACQPNTLSIPVVSAGWSGFNENLTFSVADLPAGASAAFFPTSVAPGGGSTLNLDPGTAAEGTYTIKIIATSATQADTNTIQITVVSNNFSALALQSPADGLSGVGQLPKFRWAGIADADQYELQVATSPSFASGTVVIDAPGLTADSLVSTLALTKGTVYYWRVRPLNPCGTGAWTEPFGFATLVESCNVYNAEDLPKNISTNGTPTVESKINVAVNSNISDLNVQSIKGSHDAFTQLDVRLASPAGTEILLFKNKCGFSSLTMDAGFDDASALSTFPCPPNNGQFIRPQQPLSTFNGQSSQGLWTLKIKDTEVGSGGVLTGFSLEICTASASNPPVIVNNNLLALPGGSNALISNDLLKAEDVDNTAAQLIYTLITVPTLGSLHLDGTGTLSVGAQFTQAQLDAGALRYYDFGFAGGASDSFRFAVTDGNGGFVSSAFLIQSTVGVKDPARQLGFSLAPNPASDWAQLTFGAPLPNDAQVALVDAAGRTVRSLVLAAGSNRYPLNLANLPAGVYAVHVRTGQATGIRRVVVE